MMCQSQVVYVSEFVIFKNQSHSHVTHVTLSKVGY